ncbi:MAG: hypothetical protein H0T79_13010 [Deltaproteobacteria bacterium]|nr:hypothetical protein [Deltaproteobacteria bacterium]
MRNSLLVVMSLLAVGCGPGARKDPGDGSDTPDAGGGGGDGQLGDGGGTQGTTYVFAHTASRLYRVDPDSLAIDDIGDFAFTTGSDQITDIAINKSGEMLGISFGSVYRIDPTTAAATRLSNALSGLFNGLSFVPADQLGRTGDDVLVATRNADGIVFEINPMTGSTTEIGNMGAFSSSGDLVSAAGLGTLQTADNGISADVLVQLAGTSFAATAIGTSTGFSDIWGLAYWKQRVFGFTEGGAFVLIDPTTGVGTLVQGGGPAWWGAAVTTLAPILQ